MATTIEEKLAQLKAVGVVLRAEGLSWNAELGQISISSAWTKSEATEKAWKDLCDLSQQGAPQRWRFIRDCSCTGRHGATTRIYLYKAGTCFGGTLPISDYKAIAPTESEAIDLCKAEFDRYLDNEDLPF